MPLTRAEHNALIYDWSARRRQQGRCPYCRYGRLDMNDDTGQRYSRCMACRARMALAHQRRKEQERYA